MPTGPDYFDPNRIKESSDYKNLLLIYLQSIISNHLYGTNTEQYLEDRRTHTGKFKEMEDRLQTPESALQYAKTIGVPEEELENIQKEVLDGVKKSFGNIYVVGSPEEVIEKIKNLNKPENIN